MVFDPNTLCWVDDSDAHSNRGSSDHYYAPHQQHERSPHCLLKSKAATVVVYIAIFYCAWALSAFVYKHEWQTPVEMWNDITATIQDIAGSSTKVSNANNGSINSLQNVDGDIPAQKQNGDSANPYQEPCKACGALLDFSALAHLKECDTHCPVCMASLHITFH